VLLTVGILFDDAYGLAIADELEKQTGRNIMISSVHKSLVRLEDKGYLKSHLGWGYGIARKVARTIVPVDSGWKECIGAVARPA